MNKYLNKYRRILKDNENRTKRKHEQHTETNRVNKDSYGSNKPPTQDPRNKDRKPKAKRQ